jgi:hydrogenase nickel incorporation protein HypA/HybF
MSIAAAVLDAVRTETATHPGSRAAKAGLRVGELSGVEPESLRFCLECLVAGSDLEPLSFDIEFMPWTRRCLACGREFRVSDGDPACALCGARDSEAAGGDELQLSYLELEEP